MAYQRWRQTSPQQKMVRFVSLFVRWVLINNPMTVPNQWLTRLTQKRLSLLLSSCKMLRKRKCFFFFLPTYWPKDFVWCVVVSAWFVQQIGIYKAYGFLVFEERKNRDTRAQSNKGKQPQTWKARVWRSPRFDPGHIGGSHQCLTTTSSLKTL